MLKLPMAENNPTIFGSILRGEIQPSGSMKTSTALPLPISSRRPGSPAGDSAPTHPQPQRRQPSDSALLGHLLLVAAKVAKEAGLQDWRTGINTGAEAGQSVFHLHVHVIGGRPLAWPPG